MLTQKEWLEELKAQIEVHPKTDIVFIGPNGCQIEIHDVRFDSDPDTEDTIRVILL